MESLNLSCPPLTQATVLPESQPGDCDEAPRFLLLPAFPLPARHLFESLIGHVVLLLAGFIPAMLFAPFSAEKSPLKSVQRGTTVLIAYHRDPAERSNTPARRDEPRRFSPPPGIARPVAPAVDEPPPVLAAQTEMVLQARPPGLPLPPPSAPSSLLVNVGLPMASTVHVPSLDPGALRPSSVPRAGTNTGRDPLGRVGPTGLLVKGTGGDGNGYEPPDLSARPPRSTKPQRQQPEHAAFTKPEISFMPKPEYPPAALLDRIEGDVSVKVTFDRNGHVVFRGFVRQLGNEELNSAARETVQRIRFAPATTRDGVSVDQDAVVTVTFRLTQLTLTASF